MPFDYRNFQQKHRRYRGSKGNRQPPNYHSKGKQSIQQKNKYSILFSSNYNQRTQTKKQTSFQKKLLKQRVKKQVLIIPTIDTHSIKQDKHKKNPSEFVHIPTVHPSYCTYVLVTIYDMIVNICDYHYLVYLVCTVKFIKIDKSAQKIFLTQCLIHC